MNTKCGILGQTGLQFFGRITASISHEIKNVLAVLNENAGLLEDVVLMAEKGIPLNPERLKGLAGTMGKQIQRADGIVENMNRFAHAVDEKTKEIDIHETLSLLFALTRRFADMRGVTLSPAYKNSSIFLTCNPFFLENLLWCFLDFAMEATGEGRELTIATEENEHAVQIRFEGLKGLAEKDAEAFPSERELALMEALDADFTVEQGKSRIVMAIPKKGYR